jgi:outer membrane protein assembly factor BamB
MRSKKPLYVKGKSYKKTRKKRKSLGGPLLFAATILIMITIGIAVVRYGPGLFQQGGSVGTDAPSSDQSTQLATSSATPTPPDPTSTPTPTPLPEAFNPQLLPYEVMDVLDMGTPQEGLSPSERGIKSTVFDHQNQPMTSYHRPFPLSLLDPIQYNQIPGVLTFRGNNFRNAPSYGLASIIDQTMTQDWQKGIGSLPSSAWTFSWTGTGWTGQPLLVQWDEPVRMIMNIRPEKKEKNDLVEVIYATLDGNIYFLDLDDGQPTRDPINVGAPIKGTPCVDPRGYPVLYVGQGDKNKNVDGIGFRVYNLIDQSLLLYRECSETHAYRPNWAACDSSPIFDAEADTLIFPNENGMIYTARMNTRFQAADATLSIDPEFVTYRYTWDGLSSYGIESSMSIYDHYGYFSDNSGNLHCVDLNTMRPVWSRQLEDDTDVTPVLDHEGDRIALYTGAEVDWQKDIIGNYQGDAYAYKIDALTGEILWKNSIPCYTKNAADYGDDINGGVMGTPILGKKDLDSLVFFSFCMTQGIYSGNNLVAFDRTDGSIVWEYKMSRYSWSSPVDLYDEQGRGYIVIPDSGGQLHLIDGKTGEALDVLQLTRGENGEGAGNIESSCAVFENKLVIGTRGNIITGVTIR